MVQNIKVITGKVERDPSGYWAEPGLYIDSDMIESVFSAYRGKNVKVTIEVIETSED